MSSLDQREVAKRISLSSWKWARLKAIADGAYLSEIGKQVGVSLSASPIHIHAQSPCSTKENALEGREEEIPIATPA